MRPAVKTKAQPNLITALNERLSRDDELVSKSNGITNQKRFPEDYATQRGFTNIRRFTDDGYGIPVAQMLLNMRAICEETMTSPKVCEGREKQIEEWRKTLGYSLEETDL